MRITERLMYFLGACLAVTYGLELWLWSFIFVLLILLVIILGAIFEGIRFFQWIFIVAFIGQVILVIMDTFSYIALGIYCVFLLTAIILTLIWGEANFDRVKLSGPFQVGHQDYMCKKDGIFISVWYPMDKEEHYKTLNSKTNSYWFRYGYKSRLGLTKATSSWGTEDHPSPWFYKYLDDVRMNTVQNGKLSNFFSEASGDEPMKKLTPMVYCHGLACMRTAQSISCKDFASHGFLVFSIDHFDGTANYTRKQILGTETVEEKYWTSMHDVQDKDLRIQQIAIRKQEVINIIDQIVGDKFCQNELGFHENVTLDLDRLVVGGHSFGGMTAIAVSEADERIKATIALDPWLWVVVDQIDNKEFKLNKPQCYILSEGFSGEVEKWFDFNTIKLLKKLTENDEHPTEMAEIKETHHYHQCDAIVLVPLESFLATGTKFQTNYTELYILNTQLCLHFLHRTGFVQNAPIDTIERYIEKYRKRYLGYFRKYNDESKDSPWIGSNAVSEKSKEKEEIKEDDMESLIIKNKDD